MIIPMLIVIIVYFVIWFILAAIIKNASIVDIGWGFGFVLVAWVGFLQNVTISTSISTTLVTLWGLRLTYHVFRRNYGKPEDFRYAAFRHEWGKTYYLRSFFQLFMFQAIIMFLVSLGFIYINELGTITSWLLAAIGIITWLVGYLFEAISDSQLKKFIANSNNKGKLIDSGLWKYSRHPNYFGEAVAWWGIFVLALGTGAPWFTIISPIAITVIIRFVSGVPMLEKRLAKKEGFEEYKNKTRIFVPWFPKGELNE